MDEESMKTYREEHECKYDNAYVERLEQTSEEMMIAIEQAVSCIDQSRLSLVNPQVAEKACYDALDRYNGLKRDFDGN